MHDSAVKSELLDMLRTMRFKGRGPTLYRESIDARVVHVVVVQAGRSHLQGKFTIELGAFLPSVYELHRSQPAPTRPPIEKCQVRARLAQFDGGPDTWWRFDEPRVPAALALAVHSAIPRFFDHWGDVTSILGSCAAATHGHVVRVSRFAVAALLHEERRDEEARRVLQVMYESFLGERKDIAQIERFAGKLGIHLHTEPAP
jgi:hypothetical protein